MLSVFSSVWPGLIRNAPQAEAAQVAVDTSVNVTATSHLLVGAQSVFVNDQTGYKFYRDSTGICVYSKTTDGGANWNAAVTVDAQTDCISVQVWYDRWTPGGTGTYIHIVTMDTSVDDLFYNRLDTNGDTLLMGSAPVDASVNSGNSTATFASGANAPSITKGTDGTIYLAANDATDSYVVECSASCNLQASWTETGTRPQDLANDYSILVPLASGDIMLINRDISLEDIRSKIWNNSSWSASWATIDANATDNTTYDGGLAATVSSTTPGVVYLAYTADNATLGTDDDVRVARYRGGSWTAGTDVIANNASRAITGVAIGIDAANDDVYVAYSARTTAGTAGTGNVYWKWATTSMQNWSAEQGPVNTSGADDIYGIDLNNVSDQRLLVSWYEATEDYIYADTIADIFPGIHASSSGTQTATVFASTSNVYLGGKFLLYNTYKPIDVTGITLTESGTIDGSTNIANVKLLYESDTVAPYDCATNTYDGTESQFGSTDGNGFSGADGTSAFTGTSVTVSTSSAMCVHVIFDVLDNTENGATIDISIANPTTDITATGPTGPATAQNISGTTQVLNDEPTQTHYHWRNDNGTEAGATSRTGGVEDTSLTALQQGTPVRLRLQVSNEGGSSTPSLQYRLEYAQTSGTCDAATGWTDVGATGGDFDMYDSSNLTDGTDTTDIALGSLGAVTNPGGKTFLTPNGGVKDTSSQTANILLSSTQFTELEYSIVASTSATEGNTYCFRATDKGNPLFLYSQWGRATIAADVLVSATGTQTATTNLPATNFYVGGAYVITENTGSRNVTGITISEAGTVDGATDLENIRLYYELDTSVPYNCASESYGGNEAQYGATSTAFSSANGTSTFTGSVAISTTATMCVYVVLNTTATAQNGETVNIVIESPSTNVVVSGGGTVSPATTRDITGETTLQGAVLTQTRYHFRNDNGSEAAATSATGGSENTAVTNIALEAPLRLRLQVSNEGAVSSASRAFTLEYGAKVTTCDAVGSWINVGAPGGAFDLFDSTNLTEGTDTTDVAVSLGGVTNPGGKTFLTPNSAVKDTSPYVASTTLTSSQFLETEFSIQPTLDAGYDVTYCFRLSTSEVELNAYSVYPELTTAPERDFEIQRNFFNMSGTSQTITAGVDYIAPSASTSAFIRITNSHHTGAGNNLGSNTQNADDVTVYIENPSNIMNSITFRRPAAATGVTRVSWEIIEFIGEPGSDNEMIVRSQSAVTYGTTATAATGTSVSVTDDADVVVFITGQLNPLANATGYHTGQSTSEWASATDEPVFTRGAQLTNAAIVSYAVVEFTGQNWAVQRNEHTYTNAGTTETESITAVNSLSRAFLHTQKRIGATLTGVDEFGHEVWLSSIGQISYFLESGATTPSGQTSVAWIIENTQTTSGAMNVQRKNNSTVGGVEPLTLSVTLDTALDDLTNASIFVNTRAAGTGTNYPRPIAGATIASTTAFELYRSDTLTALNYRAEIVEWPTAGLALRQTHYRFYVDNNALTPADAWPTEGGGTLGEDTVLTPGDNPLGEGDRIRIRMAVQAQNATLPAGTRAFRLQYGQMTTSCSAIPAASWNTLGNSASSTIWRGFSATGTVDGTEITTLLLTFSDVAGTLEEINDTEANPSAIQAGDEVEYDWFVEQNGATAETYYCFRMVSVDGTPLDSYASTYPQLRTASFAPRTQNWRWYDDEGSVTPAVALEGENVSPPNIPNGGAVKLRITVKETKNIAREDARFKLQYSESASFSPVFDVVATSTCTATSTWCYANGGGVDNGVIPSKLLTDADACSGGVGDGCGTHNESPDVKTGFRHEGLAATEYEFTIQSAGPRVNRVYYFRLYDTTDGIPVSAHTGESYPSLVTEGASLNFTMGGLTSGQSIEGVVLDIDTTPTTIPFGVLSPGAALEGAHRLSVDTNGTEGYQLFMTMTGDLTTAGGATISQVTGTNAAPLSWDAGCAADAPSCFGYHTGDDTLEGGSTRFSAIDTYARLSTTTLDEVSYSSQPAAGDTTDIVFRILIRDLQDAGIYETNIEYISVPIF